MNVVSAVISISGIIFQLLLASNMSYLLGNAIVQYSVTIGLFLCGMGLYRQPDRKFIGAFFNYPFFRLCTGRFHHWLS